MASKGLREKPQSDIGGGQAGTEPHPTPARTRARATCRQDHGHQPINRHPVWPESADQLRPSNRITHPLVAHDVPPQARGGPADGPWGLPRRPPDSAFEARTKLRWPRSRRDGAGSTTSCLDAAPRTSKRSRRAKGFSARSARMVLSLAFLAPDIVQAAVDGTSPRGSGVARLADLPASWNEQRRMLDWRCRPEGRPHRRFFKSILRQAFVCFARQA